MTQKKDNRILGIVHPVCCGLYVHKEKVSVCMISPDEDGNEQIAIKEFGTLTDELTQLRQWLLEHDCPVVAMESTGIYWRPVLPPSTSGNWVRAHKVGKLGDIGKTQRPLTDIEMELARVKKDLAEDRMERDLLKKAAAYFGEGVAARCAGLSSGW